MKKIIQSFVASIFLYVLPLCWNPELILDWRVAVLVLCAFATFYTQPSLKAQKKISSSDRNTFNLIMGASLLSAWSVMLEWSLVDLLPGRVSDISGVAILLSGLAIRFWAIGTLKKFFTVDVRFQKGQELVTSGPYKVVRHPSYTGAFMAFLGAAILMQATLGFIISMVAMSYAYSKRIAAEEAMLGEHFDDYKEYRKTTGALLPLALERTLKNMISRQTIGMIGWILVGVKPMFPIDKDDSCEE